MRCSRFPGPVNGDQTNAHDADADVSLDSLAEGAAPAQEVEVQSFGSQQQHNRQQQQQQQQQLSPSHLTSRRNSNAPLSPPPSQHPIDHVTFNHDDVAGAG